MLSCQALGWIHSLQDLELPPVFGKFCVMNGIIGLSGLGARAPCVYTTRDDELPGSSPAGRPQQPLLIPNWSL